jgi:hypothetical protein
MSTENLYSTEGEGSNYDTLFDAMISKKTITAVMALEGNSTDLMDNKLGEVPEGGWTAKTA